MIWVKMRMDPYAKLDPRPQAAVVMLEVRMVVHHSQVLAAIRDVAVHALGALLPPLSIAAPLKAVQPERAS